MVFKSFVSGLTPEAEAMLLAYMDVYSNGKSEVVPLTSNGLKGTVARNLPMSTTFMIIMDNSFYRQLTNGWSVPEHLVDKLHVFTTEEELETVLIAKIGFKVEVGVAPPDLLMQGGTYTASADFGSMPVRYDEEKVASLEEELERAKAEAARMQKLLDSNGTSEDLKELVQTIKELNERISVLEKEKAELKSQADKSVALEAEVAKSAATVKKVKEEKAVADHDISSLRKQVSELTLQIDTLQKEIEGYKADILDKEDEIRRIRDKVVESGDTGIEVARLTAELADSRHEIESLKSQVANGDQDGDRVVELSGQLKAAIADRDKIKIDLEASTERINTLTSSITDLRTSCQEKETQIGSLDAEKKELSGQLATLTSQLNAMQTELDKSRTEVTRLLTNSEASSKDIEKQFADYQETIRTLTAENQTSADKLRELSTELATTRGQLQTSLDQQSSEKQLHDEALNSANTQVNALRSDLESKTAQLRESETQLASIRSRLDSANADAKKSDLRIQSLERELTTLRNDATFKDSQLNMKTQEVELINESLTNQKAAFERINESLLEARKELQAKAKEIQELTYQVQTTQDEAQINSGAYDRLLSEKNNLDARIVDLERSLETSKGTVSSLEERLTAMTSKFERVSNEKMSIEADKRKLDTEIQTIRADYVEMQTKTLELEATQEALANTRRELAKANTECTSLRSQLESSTLSGLNSENMALKSELEKLRKQVVDTSALEASKNEVLQLRSRVNDLESQNAALQVRTTSGGAMGSLFAGGGDIIIKGVYNQTLRTQLQGNYSNFKLFLSGSADSTRVLYETLTRACAASHKRILILDITTDSSVDAAFGIKSAPPPVDWLCGTADFRSYLTTTRFQNVNVITTALAYVNKLYFAKVDWAARLADLNGFADLCIIILDGLGDYITKAMYNTFSKVMESYVIVHSTPTNMRAAYMALLGTTGYRETLAQVVCVKYNNNNAMLQNLLNLMLKNSMKARAMLDTEVLTL